jgi:hypothetical protein
MTGEPMFFEIGVADTARDLPADLANRNFDPVLPGEGALDP